MSTDRYFDKFPIITYSNNQAIDITKRVAILESVSQNPFIFYPYEITDGERPDQLSNRYYEDSYKSWMIYLTNKIVDPYYEWYLHQNEFEEHINKKYGDIQTAYEKVKFYRNNWVESEAIDVSRFNSLPPKLMGYWTPTYNAINQISGYDRKRIDWVINTNRIVSYTVSNTSFISDEVCTIYFNANNTGKGQICSIANDTIYIQHTSGVTVSNSEVEITANSYIYGRESGVNTAFTVSTLIVENLQEEEEIYWTPITQYDFENERNEFNKTVRIIDAKYTSTVVKNFKKLMED